MNSRQDELCGKFATLSLVAAFMVSAGIGILNGIAWVLISFPLLLIIFITCSAFIISAGSEENE